MANEDVSRIMQNKPHLRYSLAFVHIKARCKAAGVFVSRARAPARVRLPTLWNYIARASVVVSQLLPHSGVNYVYLQHPLPTHLSVSSFIRVIFRVKMHSFARDISLRSDISSLNSPLPTLCPPLSQNLLSPFHLSDHRVFENRVERRIIEISEKERSI